MLLYVMVICVFFCFHLLWSLLLWIFGTYLLVYTYTHFFCISMPRSKISSDGIWIDSVLKNTSKWFPKVFLPIYLPPGVEESSNWSIFLPTLVSFSFVHIKALWKELNCTENLVYPLVPLPHKTSFHTDADADEGNEPVRAEVLWRGQAKATHTDHTTQDRDQHLGSGPLMSDSAGALSRIPLTVIQ